MQYVFPDYYKEFACIKGECRHNCCIGWEIDIDHKTADMYMSVGGKLGEKLKNSISDKCTPHFILGENERCPFLNKDNLCEIITELGEGALCQICSDHPRFKNELPDRLEMGLGLCCEAAARLIIDRKEPMTLTVSGETVSEDEIILFRDKIIALLQDRSKGVFERIDDMLSVVGIEPFEVRLSDWYDTLFSLERLDSKWTSLLRFINEHENMAESEQYTRYISNYEYEYEQLCVYFIYRYLANATDMDEVALWAAFAAFSVKFLSRAGSVLFAVYGKFELNERLELVRMFSSEIEYSEDNLNALIDELSFLL